ncbi:EmrB/QacA subfamily drug resistance transporter [Bradyrhizobium diazoefficiens]
MFFVNLPFGAITVLGLIIFMDETRKDISLKFDWFGFAALAVAIGSLQLALDRGEQLGWLESNEIVAEFIVSAVAFYFFVAHSFTTSTPFIRFALFQDRNFVTGCMFMVVMGLVLFSTMALASPYMQNVIGYPIITAGLLLASRGFGTFFAMMLVGRMMRYFEARTLIISGLTLTAGSLYQMTGWTDLTQVPEIVTVSVIQGFGFGLVFVPLSTVAFLTLSNELRTDGTAMLTLMRNVASSVGISVVIAQLTQGTRRTYAILSEHVNPFNHALQMPSVSGMINLSTDAGRAMADRMVSVQAQIIAFAHDYMLVMVFILCTIPLALLIGSTKATLRRQAAGPEHAVRSKGRGVTSSAVVLDKRSADPGPITPGRSLAKTRDYQLRATTSPWGNGSWLSPGRQQVCSVAYPNNSSHPRSSTAIITRSRLFHQISGGMLMLHCQTGPVMCQSTDRR